MVSPNFTVTYKVVDGLPVKADIYLPPPSESYSNIASLGRPALVQFHAGGATSGNRASYFPEWLRASAVAQGWIFVSADYRLLQPSTGHDIVDDVQDLFAWLSGPTPELNDETSNPGRLRIANPPRIGVVGTSGGGVPGYLAALYAQPKPVVFLAMYCMTGNFHTPRYILPKTEIFFQGKPLLDAYTDSNLLPYLSFPSSIPAISDSPLVYNEDGTSANIRTLLTRLFLQEAIYLDVLTGHDGVSLSLRGLDRAPFANDFTPEERKLIPMFNFTREFPPTCLVHGTGDTAILFEESDAVATRLAAIGVENEFIQVPGADHLFDFYKGEEMHKEYTDKAFAFLRKYLD